jgi:hypothetical protein
MKAFTDYPDPIPPYANPRVANSETVFQSWHTFTSTGTTGVLGDYLQDSPDSVDPDNSYHCWLKLVTENTSKELNKEKDKLRAIASLARAINEILKDEYFAGIWKKDLMRELCWSPSSHQIWLSKPH